MPFYALKIKEKLYPFLRSRKMFLNIFMHVSLWSFKSIYPILLFDPHKKPRRKDGWYYYPHAAERENRVLKSDVLKARTVWQPGVEQDVLAPAPEIPPAALSMGSPRPGVVNRQVGNFLCLPPPCQRHKVTTSQQHESGFLGLVYHRASSRD